MTQQRSNTIYLLTQASIGCDQEFRSFDLCRLCGRAGHFVSGCQEETNDRWTNGLRTQELLHTENRGEGFAKE